MGTSQPWLYTDPAVAVSRGLLAPANFLIDVMRGAPSLSKKEKNQALATR